ncbi:MAG: hypothetical protein HON90_07995 [Halobacteriovoraceae bacterium]|jgi:hypothetical protein|nr:hypothetical protein [Halobacteriovoraceae bacterium]
MTKFLMTSILTVITFTSNVQAEKRVIRTTRVINHNPVQTIINHTGPTVIRNRHNRVDRTRPRVIVNRTRPRVVINPAGPRYNNVELYHDDGRCKSRNYIQSIGPRTSCNTLYGRKNVWGIKVNGVCENITDVDAVSACEMYKYSHIPVNRVSTVQLYHDDGSCRASKLIANVDRYTNCNEMRHHERVWGVRVNGVCQDITDMDADRACEAYKPVSTVRVPRHVPTTRPTTTPVTPVRLYKDDGQCRSDKFVGKVTQQTVCAEMYSRSQRVWGVRVNGQCMDITDTDAVSACRDYKWQAGR